MKSGQVFQQKCSSQKDEARWTGSSEDFSVKETVHYLLLNEEQQEEGNGDDCEMFQVWGLSMYKEEVTS